MRPSCPPWDFDTFVRAVRLAQKDILFGPVRTVANLKFIKRLDVSSITVETLIYKIGKIPLVIDVICFSSNAIVSVKS